MHTSSTSKLLAAALLTVSLMPAPAHADRDDHHDWHGREEHHHDGFHRDFDHDARSHFFFSFGNAGFGPGFYDPFYRPAPVVYRPAGTVVRMQCANGETITVRSGNINYAMAQARQYCDQQDMNYFNQTNVSWRTPEPQNDGYCREYQRQVTIGGRVQQSYGQACLQPDGSWQVQN